MERAAILGDGKRLEVAQALGGGGPRLAPPQPAAVEPPDTGSGPMDTLDRAMSRHIEKALAATHGRIEGPHGAARLLDINPHTLRARMRKLGIAWKRYRDAGE
jgi:transcriptional regulator with GAF, ATPase, and Fis domain